MTELETNHTAPETISPSSAFEELNGENVADTIDATAIESSHQVPQSRKSSQELIAEARKYRKRAQAAEHSAEDLKSQLAAREQQLQQQQSESEIAAQSQQLEAMLREANPIDFDAARVLAHDALRNEPNAELATVVAELKRSKPYLFQQTAAPVGASRGVMCASSNAQSSRHVSLARAAELAGNTGKRTDVLRYLRLRRSGN